MLCACSQQTWWGQGYRMRAAGHSVPLLCPHYLDDARTWEISEICGRKGQRGQGVGEGGEDERREGGMERRKEGGREGKKEGGREGADRKEGDGL